MRRHRDLLQRRAARHSHRLRTFGNGGTSDFGNVVTTTADSTSFTIPVWWADPIPTIVVSFSDTVECGRHDHGDHGDLIKREPQGVLGLRRQRHLRGKDWARHVYGPPALAVEVSFSTTERSIFFQRCDERL